MTKENRIGHESDLVEVDKGPRSGGTSSEQNPSEEQKMPSSGGCPEQVEGSRSE